MTSMLTCQSIAPGFTSNLAAPSEDTEGFRCREPTQAVWWAKSHALKDHRIEIETHEDPVDPREKGDCSASLGSVVYAFFGGVERSIGRRGIPRALLAQLPVSGLELRTHDEDCWQRSA